MLGYGGNVEMAAAHPRGVKMADADLVNQGSKRFEGKTKAGATSGAVVEGATSNGTASSSSASSETKK